MPEGTVVSSMSVPTLAVLVASTFATTILTTYALCIHEDKCPRLPRLPTISDTWVPVPGNYLSRIVVGYDSALLQLGNLAMFYLNQARRSPSTPSWYPSNKFLLIVALIAIFLLSWVGAICDSARTPSCDGNDGIHSTCAVIFFILYNIYLVFMVKMPVKEGWEATSVGQLSVLLAISTVFKLRFIPAVRGHFDETPLAVIEWSDVGLIMVVLVKFLSETATRLSLSIVRLPAQQQDGNEKKQLEAEAKQPLSVTGGEATVLQAFTLRHITSFGDVVASLTLLTTYAIALHQHVVPHDRLPDIPDMFVNTPSNWFSRWGMVVTSAALVALNSVAHVSRADSTVVGGRRGLFSMAYLSLTTLVGVVSSVSLALYGAANIVEGPAVHDAAGAVFFAGYTGYMLLYLLDEAVATPSTVGWSTVGKVVCYIVSLVSKLRWPTVAAWVAKCLCSTAAGRAACSSLGLDADGNSHVDPSVYQWMDVVSVMLFLHLTMQLAPTARRFALAITTPPKGI